MVCRRGILCIVQVDQSDETREQGARKSGTAPRRQSNGCTAVHSTFRGTAVPSGVPCSETNWSNRKKHEIRQNDSLVLVLVWHEQTTKMAPHGCAQGGAGGQAFSRKGWKET